MSFFLQAFLVGMGALAVYELVFPVCQQCQGRRRRWSGVCRRCAIIALRKRGRQLATEGATPTSSR